MRVTVTGATGRIGRLVVERLLERGDEVTVLSRDAQRARAALDGVEAHAWDPVAHPAPVAALAGRDAVVNLAGEDVGQRWRPRVKDSIRASREEGTRNLVAGIAATSEHERPRVLASASAAGYYGARGEEAITEEEPPGEDFLAEVCVAWEREAQAAEQHGLRVVRLRTGVVLDREAGALRKMLPPFRAGLGGPVGTGRQWVPWIHRDDVADLYLAAVDDDRWSGPVNANAPKPVTNRTFSKALGRVLRRPVVAPVPAVAMRVLFGEMSMIVLTGQRMVPARALELGHEFRHAEIEAALRSVIRG